MTDRELLEKAAKAAGMKPGMWFDGWNDEGRETGAQWNPLIDDGDALRLAVKLRMCVDAWGSGASAVVAVSNGVLVSEPHYGDDPERATRRAIVRAAAALAD